MNENEKETNPIKNIQEQEKLKIKYEEENQAQEAKINLLENTITKKNDEIFELQKSNKNLSQERDDWKKEAHSQRKVQAESKQHREQQDFLTSLKKLQEKKGLKWDDESQTWTNTK